MEKRKISGQSFEGRGPVNRALSKQMRAAHISKAGQERIIEGLKFSAKTVAQKEGLRYGVGEKFADRLAAIPLSKKYAGRREFLPKEKKLLGDIPGILFNRKPVAPKVEKKAEMKVESKRFTPPPPRALPAKPEAVAPPPHISITAPASSSETVSIEPMSPKNDEGSETKSAP